MTYMRIFFLVLVMFFCPFVCRYASTSVIQGTVVNAEGAPVVESAVFLNQERQVRTAVTGTDGVYRFDDIPVRTMELVAYHPDYALGGVTTVPIGDMEITLVLGKPTVVPIRVINNNFLPVPGARITAMTVNDQFSISVEDLGGTQFPQLRSDDSGILDIPCIPENGFVKITLAHHQYAFSDIAYLPTDGLRRDLILYEGVRVRGRITADAQPVANARVSLFQAGVAGQRTFAEALSDPEGFYHLRAPEDSYLITARHPDYASPPPVKVLLEQGEQASVADINLLAPYSIRGRVLFPDNIACPGARIQFRIEDLVLEETFSNAEGRFLLQSGSPDGVLRVIPPPGYMTEILADIPVALKNAREATLNPIKLKQLPVVRGRAIFPEGVPPEKLYIHSLDLPVPFLMLTDEEGGFELHFFYQPEQSQISFRIEHPFRFLRRDFVVNLEAPAEVELLLEEFNPDLERRPYQAGQNNLEALFGKPAPAFECSDWYNTEPLTLENLRGKVVVLFFWGGFNTSPAALSRLAEMNLIHDLYAEQSDLVLIGIHDAGSEAVEVEAYIKEHGITFPVGRDKDPFVSFINYNINIIPQTVVIDKQGVLQYAQTEARLLALIKALRRRP